MNGVKTISVSDKALRLHELLKNPTCWMTMYVYMLGFQSFLFPVSRLSQRIL